MRIINILLFFISFSLTAQQIDVLDGITGNPVKNITISNKEKTILLKTNAEGKVDLSKFKQNELIYFSHIEFHPFEEKKSIVIANKKIFLSRNTKQLDEIILNVFKSDAPTNRIAEQTAIINAKQIQKNSPQTSADLLAITPGVKVQKSQSGGGSPVLRGMESNRVLLVVDGVRMNNAIYRKGHLQNSISVSPNILDKVEVVFGPSSVIYGSDALGGVIHYYTKTPKLSKNNTIKGDFFTRYSSANNEITTAFNTELRFKNWASFSSISHSDFGELTMGSNRNHGFKNWGIVKEYTQNNNDLFYKKPTTNTNPNLQPNTKYQQTDILQKFYFPITQKTNLKLNFQYSTASNIPRFDKLIEYKKETLKFAEWAYGDQKRLLLSPQLSFKPNKKWMKEGTITLAYQNIKESRIQRKFKNPKRSTRKEKLNVFSINGDFSLNTKKNRNLSYGFEVTYNNVNSKAIGEIIHKEKPYLSSKNFKVQSRYPDGGSSYMSSAIYTNYRQDINLKSTLNTGVRLTNTQLQANWKDETFIKLPDNSIHLKNTALTATIGYVYKFAANWQLNSVLSSGFRSPNIDDVGKVREKKGKITVPNINLKPEYAYNAEIGLQKYFNNKKFRLEANFYYTLLDNYIYRNSFILDGKSQILYDDELGDLVANVNKGNAYVLGGTFGFQGKLFPNWYTSGSVTYTKGESYDIKEPLSSIPPIFGNSRFNFRSKNYEFGLNFKFNAKKLATSYNLSEGIDNIEQTPVINVTSNQKSEKYYGTPSWWTIGIDTKLKITSTIFMQARLDNILDVHYKEFASGISASGRNLSISLHASF